MLSESLSCPSIDHQLNKSSNSLRTSQEQQQQQQQQYRLTGISVQDTSMPRYHYSRSTSTSNDSDPTLIHDVTEDRTDKRQSSNGNDQVTTGGTFQSTFIPFLPTNRLMTGQKREYVQIPITREDNGGSSSITNTRTVPITFTNETTNIIPLTNQTNGTHSSPSNQFINFLRPSSRYFQQQMNDESVASSLPRINLVPRRSSLTLPVMTAATATVTSPIPNDDIDGARVTITTPLPRQIPIRLVSSPTVNPSNTRISSAVPRLAPINNNNALQRPKTDIDEMASSSSFINNSTNGSNNLNPMSTSDFTGPTTSIRRAEVMAREAIQGLARHQHQQRNQTLPSNRSPSSSRRVIINLQNNQSVLLDSRLSSSKPPVASNPFSSSSSSSSPLSSSPSPLSSIRSAPKSNLFYIPVLHEIQMPSDPKSSSTNGSFKNEFHMEIPVTVVTNNDQENHLDQPESMRNDNVSEFRLRDRSASTSNSHPNPTLKSILKRSSSRDNVPRKNVSFMNT